MKLAPKSIVAGLGLAGFLLLAGCGHRGADRRTESPLPSVTVRVEPIVRKPHQATEEVVGTVRAKLHATLEAKVAGRIEEMPVVAGQAVAAGDLIAVLDVREIQAKLDQARAVLDQAKRERDRFAALLQQKAATQAEFDAVEARYGVAEGSMKEAESMLGYARVVAPFAGVVSRKYADLGDLATPGRPLVEIEDPKALRLEADVPEALIGQVERGGKMAVRVSTVNEALVGVVSEIAPAADPNSRTFRVKLDLPDAAGLRLGLFGRVAVPVGETTALRVPVSAVVQRGQMEIVFVAVNQRAQLRLVKTGQRYGDEVELVSGVSAGEGVVAEGAGGLVDGQPVSIKNGE